MAVGCYKRMTPGGWNTVPPLVSFLFKIFCQHMKNNQHQLIRALALAAAHSFQNTTIENTLHRRLLNSAMNVD